MTTMGEVTALSMRAAADLRLKRYHVMRQSAAGTTNQASNPGAGPDAVIGILQNNPNSGQAATIGYFGETKAVAGGSVTLGVDVTANTSGRVTAAVSGDYMIGMALEAAANDGENIRILLRCPAVRKTF